MVRSGAEGKGNTEVASDVPAEGTTADSLIDNCGEDGTFGAGSTSSQTLRIAHLSDLHFGRTFDGAVWEYIKDSIRSAQPTLIVASGDFVNHPLPMVMLRAKCEIQALAKDCGAELIVVPGNHDVGFWGMFQIPVFRRIFYYVFKEATEFEQTLYREYSDAKQASARVRTAVARARMFLRSLRYLVLTLIGKTSTRETYPRCWEGKQYFLACVDSNHNLMAASGSVNPTEMYRLAIRYRAWLEQSRVRSVFAPRFVVVHHHLLPIPYAEDDALEGTLVLRNAGTLARELQGVNCDLVLHGHKHLHSMARVSFGGADSHPLIVGVLAAGSAGKRHTNAGRNNWNLITLTLSGRIEITRHFCGGSSTEAGRAARSFYLHDTSEFKHRQFLRARECQKYWCRRKTLDVEIDDFGTSLSRIVVEGLKTVGDHKLSSMRHKVTTKFGRVLENSVRLVSGSGGASVEWKDPSTEVEVRFNREINSGSEPLDIAVEYSSFNSYTLTEWEAEEVGRVGSAADSKDKGTPYFQRMGMTMKYPCEELVLRLRVGEKLGGLRPRLRVYRPVTWDAVSLNDVGEMVVKEFVPDSEMSEAEVGMLGGGMNREWEAHIRFPLPAFQYRLRWDLREVQNLPPGAEALGKVAHARRVLVEHGRRRQLASGPGVVGELLGEFLNAFPKAWRAKDKAERLSASMMVYNPQKGNLRMVDGARTWDEELSWDLKFSIGEGLAGAAFKQGRPLLFVRPALEGRIAEGTSSGSGLWLEPRSFAGDGFKTRYEVMVSVPFTESQLSREWQAGERSLGAREIVGVVNIGTTSSLSALVRLADDDSACKQFLKQLTALVHALASGALAALAASE